MEKFKAYVRRFAKESEETLKNLHFHAKGYEKERIEKLLIIKIYKGVTMKNPGASPLIAQTLDLFLKARLEKHYSAEHFVDELSALFGPEFNLNVVMEIGYHFVPKNLVFSNPAAIGTNVFIMEDIKQFVHDLGKIFSLQLDH